LQKTGLPALEPTLKYLKEAKEKGDDIGMVIASEILGGIKDERSFKALVDMLSYQDIDVQNSAIDELSRYGDKRAVEYLERFLENADARDYVSEVIRKLVTEEEYQSITARHRLETHCQRCNGLTDKVYECWDCGKRTCENCGIIFVLRNEHFPLCLTCAKEKYGFDEEESEPGFIELE